MSSRFTLHASSPESEQNGDQRRRLRSQAYDIARKAFSRADVNIEDILRNYTGYFRTMVANEYADMEDAARRDDDFNHFMDSY